MGLAGFILLVLLPNFLEAGPSTLAPAPAGRVALRFAATPEKQETEEELRARLSAEPDLIRKARLALRLAEIELDTATKRYEESDWEQGAASLKQMLDDVEEVYKHLAATGRDPRRNPKGFKETEIKLRTFLRRLEDLRASLPLDDRPPLDKVATRTQEIRQALLDGLLQPKGKKKEGK